MQLFTPYYWGWCRVVVLFNALFVKRGSRVFRSWLLLDLWEDLGNRRDLSVRSFVNLKGQADRGPSQIPFGGLGVLGI